MASITAKDYLWTFGPFLVGFLFGCITGGSCFYEQAIDPRDY